MRPISSHCIVKLRGLYQLPPFVTSSCTRKISYKLSRNLSSENKKNDEFADLIKRNQEIETEDKLFQDFLKNNASSSAFDDVTIDTMSPEKYAELLHDLQSVITPKESKSLDSVNSHEKPIETNCEAHLKDHESVKLGNSNANECIVEQVPKSKVIQEPVFNRKEKQKLFESIEMLIKGHDEEVLKSYLKFVKMAVGHLEIQTSQICLIPYHMVRRTLLRSPHIHKRARVQYEQRTYQRSITFFRLTENNANVLLSYLQYNLPEGVAMELSYKYIEPLPETLKL